MLACRSHQRHDLGIGFGPHLPFGLSCTASVQSPAAEVCALAVGFCEMGAGERAPAGSNIISLASGQRVLACSYSVATGEPMETFRARY